MAIVNVKNPELYREWINYILKAEGVSEPTPSIRTEAFFNSQAAMPVPLYR